MKQIEVPSYPLSILIGGNPIEAEGICRAYCDTIGYCVTVTPTVYVYRGGREPGVIIGLINYGRFPNEPAAIFAHGRALGESLREGMRQESFTIQAPDKTLWVSHRPEDNL